MVKSLIDMILPGSRKLADEFMLPLAMTVAISVLAGVVGTVGVSAPVQLNVGPAMASAPDRGCVVSQWPRARTGFLPVGTQRLHGHDRCRL